MGFLIKVTIASHGYDGWLGICPKHPQYWEYHKTLNMLPANDPKPEIGEEANILQIIQKAAQEGNTMTPSDILAVWNSSRPSEISVDGGSSGVSTITISANSTPVSLLFGF